MAAGGGRELGRTDSGAEAEDAISKLEDMAEKMVGKLDAQDDGKTAKGRRASDRNYAGFWVMRLDQAA